jgi:hypothetical protein
MTSALWREGVDMTTLWRHRYDENVKLLYRYDKMGAVTKILRYVIEQKLL